MSEISQDDVDLNYYEGIRKQMVQSIVAKGVPTDPEMAGLLLKAIDGGGRVILTKKRLTVDQEASENMANTQNVIAEILRSSPTAKQRLRRTESLSVVDMVPPKPGEAEVGTKMVRYTDIMQKDPKG